MNGAMNTAATNKAPWQFWAVSAVSLLWNAFGGVDYTMTQTRNVAWLAGMPPQVMQAIDAAPLWAMAAWAIGVWGSLAGSILLLLRTRFAIWAFAASLLGAVISFGWQFSVGIASPPMAIAIVGVVVLLLWYARRQAAGGVLR